MVRARVCLDLDYTESFDYEDLREIFHRVLDDALAQKRLDMRGEDNAETPATRIECIRIVRVCPDWVDDPSRPEEGASPS